MLLTILGSIVHVIGSAMWLFNMEDNTFLLGGMIEILWILKIVREMATRKICNW